MDRTKALMVSALRRHLAGGRPIVPEAGVVFWNLFMEISASRTYHAAGPHPISYAEIEAFSRIHRWPLQSHHVAIIRALDEAWMSHAYADARKGADRRGRIPSGRQQGISPAAFDAVFG